MERFDPSVDWLRDAIDEDQFWEVAVETDATVQILYDHSQLDQAIELVETYLFDHFAHAGPETPTDESTFAQFAGLATYDNVAVKISEIAHMSEERSPYRDMHDHVRWFLDRFGRERVLWGSDYPNVSGVAGYSETRHWLDAVDGISGTDCEWLTGRSFREHVGIG